MMSNGNICIYQMSQMADFKVKLSSMQRKHVRLLKSFTFSYSMACVPGDQ